MPDPPPLQMHPPDLPQPAQQRTCGRDGRSLCCPRPAEQEVLSQLGSELRHEQLQLHPTDRPQQRLARDGGRVLQQRLHRPSEEQRALHRTADHARLLRDR